MAHKEPFVRAIVNNLVKYKAITEDRAQELQHLFAASPKEYFDDFVLEEGLVQESDLLRALAEHFQVPSCDATGHFFETFLLRKFPKGFLLRNVIIPLVVDEDALVVVASDPERDGLESAIREFVSYDIVYEVGLRRDICDAVKEFYDESPSEDDEDSDVYEKEEEDQVVEEILNSDDMVDDADNADDFEGTGDSDSYDDSDSAS